MCILRGARIVPALALAGLVSGQAGPALGAARVQADRPALSAPAVANLIVTDIYGAGFAVTFTTRLPVTGALVYGRSPRALTSKAYDERDNGGRPPTRSTVHRVTVSGLSGGAKYYFEPVVSGVPLPASGHVPYSQALPMIRSFPPMPRNASGRVLLQNGSLPLPGSVLIIARWRNTDGSQSSAVSVFDKAAGAEPRNYDLLVGPVVNQAASDYYPITPGNSVLVVVAEGDVREHLVVGGPVTVPLSPRVTLVPDIRVAP